VTLATLTLAVVLVTEELLNGGVDAARAVLIAAVASTAFILFISPHSNSADVRHSLGGHLWALVIGGVLAWGAGTGVVEEWVTDVPELFALYAAFGVGISIFAMTATNTEHPLAAGTALGIVAHGFDWGLIVFVSTAVAILVAVHWVLRNRLVDLY
jgi:CBS domain-containing membrane protein